MILFVVLVTVTVIVVVLGYIDRKFTYRPTQVTLLDRLLHIHQESGLETTPPRLRILRHRRIYPPMGGLRLFDIAEVEIQVQLEPPLPEFITQMEPLPSPPTTPPRITQSSNAESPSTPYNPIPPYRGRRALYRTPEGSSF